MKGSYGGGYRQSTNAGDRGKEEGTGRKIIDVCTPADPASELADHI